MANAIFSQPSGPFLVNYSVSVVKPDISANITTDLRFYFYGSLNEFLFPIVSFK